MKLTDTIEMMVSADYKERFRAEYFQLNNRIDGLYSMLKKYREGTLSFTPSCSCELLKYQYVQMWRYRECLIKRAEIEKISLEEEI